MLLHWQQNEQEMKKKVPTGTRDTTSLKCNENLIQLQNCIGTTYSRHVNDKKYPSLLSTIPRPRAIKFQGLHIHSIFHLAKILTKDENLWQTAYQVRFEVKNAYFPVHNFVCCSYILV